MREKKNIKLDIVNLLDEIQNGKYSNIQMNYYFSQNEYSKKEREFITNIINITLKNLIFVDYMLGQTVRNIQKRKIKQLLRISAAQILFMDSDNAGVVYEAGEISKIINKHQTGFVNATLQSIIKNKEEIINAMPEDKKEGIVHSYPQWFVNKLKTDYPDDYTGIMKAYKERSYLSVRYNRKKLSKDDFEKILSEIKSEILFSADEVYYLSNGNILATDEYKRGDIIIQDASSYIAVKNLGVTEEDIVLDACAAPGGKSLAILQTFSPKLLLATDIHEHKIEVMKKMKEKYGYDNFEVKLNDATKIENLNMKFDKILLDVPCSGLGVLRKKPEKIYNLTSDDIKNLKKLQKKIFDSAYACLNDDGIILYSTCTFTENENTNNLKYFLEKYDNLKVEEIEVPENVIISKDEFGGTYISYKNQYLDGFYIVKLKKTKK
jgi:putative ribosomal RNA small subunit methyltransferase B